MMDPVTNHTTACRALDECKPRRARITRGVNEQRTIRQCRRGRGLTPGRGVVGVELST
jgi:hypothetical protein